MSEPTTDQVRLDYMYAYPSTPDGREIAGAEFDRWLAERDRQVAERAWDACVEEAHALGWLHDFAKSDALARNPHRAAKGEQSNG